MLAAKTQGAQELQQRVLLLHCSMLINVFRNEGAKEPCCALRSS